MTLDDPSIECFVHAPVIANVQCDALDAYMNKIDFDVVFGTLKALLKCKRRADITPRALKMSLPRLSCDHGGDRRAQELVQKMRRVCTSTVINVNDCIPHEFYLEFKQWKRQAKMDRELRMYSRTSRKSNAGAA